MPLAKRCMLGFPSEKEEELEFSEMEGRREGLLVGGEREESSWISAAGSEQTHPPPIPYARERNGLSRQKPFSSVSVFCPALTPPGEICFGYLHSYPRFIFAKVCPLLLDVFHSRFPSLYPLPFKASPTNLPPVLDFKALILKKIPKEDYHPYRDGHVSSFGV